uniref:Uncharacterized protein n=1 Tax=Rhizophora mucronata TaxID=61149 RepID=A0A2P2JC28_RHIMU
MSWVKHLCNPRQLQAEVALILLLERVIHPLIFLVSLVCKCSLIVGKFISKFIFMWYAWVSL